MTTTTPKRKVFANTITFSGRFYAQIKTLAAGQRMSLRGLVRQICARAVETDVVPRAAEPANGRPSKDRISTYSLTFKPPLYEGMKALAERRGVTIRELVRLVCKREIELAVRAGKVSGPIFEGPIGEDPYDLTQPQFSRGRKASA